MRLVHDSVIVNLPSLFRYRVSVLIHWVVCVLLQDRLEIGLDFNACPNQELVRAIRVRRKIFVSRFDKFKKPL